LFEVETKIPEAKRVVVIGHGKPLSYACVRSGRKGCMDLGDSGLRVVGAALSADVDAPTEHHLF
jgi:hypothetical protein